MFLLWEPTAWLIALLVSLWQLVRRRRAEPEPELVEIIFWRGENPLDGAVLFDAIRGSSQ